jgi:hypothetical protein
MTQPIECQWVAPISASLNLEHPFEAGDWILCEWRKIKQDRRIIENEEFAGNAPHWGVCRNPMKSSQVVGLSGKMGSPPPIE